jgi:hypothetical protein
MKRDDAHTTTAATLNRHSLCLVDVSRINAAQQQKKHTCSLLPALHILQYIVAIVIDKSIKSRNQNDSPSLYMSNTRFNNAGIIFDALAQYFDLFCLGFASANSQDGCEMR